ncbi:MAG: hypothetical protein ACOCMZ_03450 [Acetivibrio ethanolgignens]
MKELSTIQSYSQFKEALGTELRNQAEGFVRTGYLLKVARDTDILRESGYATVAEFAKAEYGLTKDIVSRYIAINDRFSEGGYSETLNARYQDYGVAKLAEMLTLPDSVLESMSPELTRREIQEMKRDVSEEEKITDLEVMLEGQQPQQKRLSTLLSKALHQYGKENPEKYIMLHGVINNTVYNTITPVVEGILDVMAPSGIAMERVRLQGIGLIMLSIKGADNNIEVLNVRSNQKEAYLWDDMISALEELSNPFQEPKESWEELYGEPFPEKKEEVAPVQQPENAINAKCETKKEVKKPEPEEKEVKNTAATSIYAENKDFTPEAEEQIPGQTSIDDHPEWIPDDQKTESKEPENAINAKCEVDSVEETEEKVKECKNAIYSDLEEFKKALENENYYEARMLLENVARFVKKIERMR